MADENTQLKIAMQRRSELLATALEGAQENGGVWLNGSGKAAPRLYPHGASPNPLNSIIMSVASDANGFRTNAYTFYNVARSEGAGVKGGEKGIPMSWYVWDKYVNRNNPDDVITREAYDRLSDEDRGHYKGVKRCESRICFNIDQTHLPHVDNEAYMALVNGEGASNERTEAAKNGTPEIMEDMEEFLKAADSNFVKIRNDGSGVAHYDARADVVYLPDREDFADYRDYMQEANRQLVSATGHSERLSRIGTGDKAPSLDDVRQERLVVELASASMMLNNGMPARLSAESLPMVEYWARELRENPKLISVLESDVNAAVGVLNRVALGETISYNSTRNQQATEQYRESIPKHYVIADELAAYPDKAEKRVVIVRDAAGKCADVVLPAGASIEVDNEVPGMSKKRIAQALKKDGFETVRFYNPDGALGYRPDDTYFSGKDVRVSKLRQYQLVDVLKLDVSGEVAVAGKMNFDQVQMLQDDDRRWAMYIKPETGKGFCVYPDKQDTNRFFTALRQAQDNLDSIRVELAEKYYAMAEARPELKVDVFGTGVSDADLNRITKVNIFKGRNDTILCAAKIDGIEKTQYKPVTRQQWQRLWLTDDRELYKHSLAAHLFADILHKGESEKQGVIAELAETENYPEKREEKIAENGKSEEVKIEPTEQKQETQSANEEQKVPVSEEQKAVSSTRLSALLENYDYLKKKHPDAVLLFRVGDFYETYKEDAERASKILGLAVTNRQTGNDRPIKIVGFPHYSLDTYLPKLVRANCRVAICEEPAPKITESVTNSNQLEHRSGMRR
ncbi:MAG: zincin-like metallopeptidase domain-containing protein [Bacteroidales bacterium]|nr:zincin-like metallopeptidase domain-containing protein [Bacteroidales bacterium]